MKLKVKTVWIVDDKATGEAIRKLRIKAGLSLRAVARVLDISAAFLSDLELGRRHWTQERANEISRILEQ